MNHKAKFRFKITAFAACIARFCSSLALLCFVLICSFVALLCAHWRDLYRAIPRTICGEITHKSAQGFPCKVLSAIRKAEFGILVVAKDRIVDSHETLGELTEWDESSDRSENKLTSKASKQIR